MPLSAKSDAESFNSSRNGSSDSSSKPRRGRPPTLKDESERRKRRNISLSDNAWEHLETLATTLGYPSKSDLLERIGKEELVVTKPSEQTVSVELADILIYRRLQGLFSADSDVLHSLLAFNTAIYHRLDALDGHSLRQMMMDNLIASMSVVFQHCYIRPDRYVNSLSALSRLINYCLLLNQAKLQDDWLLGSGGILATNADEHLLHSDDAHDCLTSIGSAMKHLSDGSFSLHFTALRLKYVSGFTEAQIQQIYRLQGLECSIEDIRALVHKGWTKFRQHRHKPSKLGPSGKSMEIPREAAKYCQLLWTSSLTQASDRHALLRILLKATYNAPLNFWLCEIEHEWAMRSLGPSSEQVQGWTQVQREIQRQLTEKLQGSKDAIDKEMHYCLNREEAVHNLTAIFEKETGICPGTKLGQFMVRLLKGEAEEQFALAELRHLRRSNPLG